MLPGPVSSYHFVYLCTGSINRPGGTGRITKIHYASDGTTVDSLDVKYVVSSGCDTFLDLSLVKPQQQQESTGRRPRRNANIFQRARNKIASKTKQAIKKAHTPAKPAKKGRGKRFGRRRLPPKPTFRPSTSPTVALSPSQPSPMIPSEIVVDRQNDSPASAFTPMGPPACLPPRDDTTVKTTSLLCGQAATISSPPLTTTTSRNLGAGDFTTESESLNDQVRVSLKLRDAFDESLQKATQFVGEIVYGRPNQPPNDERHSNKQNDDDNKEEKEKLDRFCNLLTEILQNGDGMCQEADVVQELSQYYEANETEILLDQLCTQDKIMKTDGFIFNV